MSNDDRSAERINDVLVVGVQDETVGHLAYRERKRNRVRLGLFER